MTELKPCPFCGDKLTKEEYIPLRYRYRHKNNECLIKGYCVYEHEVEKWNRRVNNE